MNKLDKSAQFLREAASKASESIGELFGTPLQVEAFRMHKGRLREILVESKSSSDAIVGAVFNVEKLKGYFVFCMTPQNAHACTKRLDPSLTQVNTNGPDGGFDERRKSIITEVANIFAGSFLGILADSQHVSIPFGAPGFVQDSTTAVLDSLISEVTRHSPVLTKVDISIASQDEEIKATVYMISPLEEELAPQQTVEPILMDGLSELASIGASYASSALYQKTKAAVSIEVPRVLMLGADPAFASRKINVNMHHPVVMSHEFHGRTINGDLILVLDSDHLKTLIQKCYALDLSHEKIEDSVQMQQQIKQFAQTISGAFLLAMGQEVNIAFAVEVAHIIYDPFEKVLADKVLSIGVENICAFLINFKIEQTDARRKDEITGFLCLLLNRSNIDELLKNMKSKLS